MERTRSQASETREPQALQGLCKKREYKFTGFLTSLTPRLGHTTENLSTLEEKEYLYLFKIFLAYL